MSQKIIIITSINAPPDRHDYSISAIGTSGTVDHDIQQIYIVKRGMSDVLKKALSLGFKMQQVDNYEVFPGERWFLTKECK